MRRSLAISTVLMVAAFAGHAFAGPYVGASFVSTDSEFDSAVHDFEADDSSFKVFGGFNVFKFFGLEATYRDLGSHEEVSGVNSIDADIESFDLCARGILPVGGRVSLFAKAGYANISSDGHLDLGGSIQSFDESDWELMYGLGVDVKLLKYFGLRAEWETYDVEDDLNSLSVGAFFRF